MTASLWFTIGGVVCVLSGAAAGVWLVLRLDQRVTDRDVFWND